MLYFFARKTVTIKTFSLGALLRENLSSVVIVVQNRHLNALFTGAFLKFKSNYKVYHIRHSILEHINLPFNFLFSHLNFALHFEPIDAKLMIYFDYIMPFDHTVPISYIFLYIFFYFLLNETCVYFM